MGDIIHQRTPEWYTARLGKFTASNFFELMTKPLNNSEDLSVSAVNYIRNIAQQLYLSEQVLRPDNDATRWGMRYEDEALSEFRKVTGFRTSDSGFLVHPGYSDVGATPDAIVIENNEPEKLVLVQVKCPYSQKKHIQYSKKIRDAASLKKYGKAIHWQIQGEIWVAGASHSYFVSYDPRLWDRKRLYYAKIERDQQAVDQLETVIPKAIALRDEFIEEFNINGYKI
jgi:hypothetical protein